MNPSNPSNPTNSHQPSPNPRLALLSLYVVDTSKDPSLVTINWALREVFTVPLDAENIQYYLDQKAGFMAHLQRVRPGLINMLAPLQDESISHSGYYTEEYQPAGTVTDNSLYSPTPLAPADLDLTLPSTNRLDGEHSGLVSGEPRIAVNEATASTSALADMMDFAPTATDLTLLAAAVTGVKSAAVRVKSIMSARADVEAVASLAAA